jgi:hypothetical protein
MVLKKIPFFFQKIKNYFIKLKFVLLKNAHWLQSEGAKTTKKKFKCKHAGNFGKHE